MWWLFNSREKRKGGRSGGGGERRGGGELLEFSGSSRSSEPKQLQSTAFCKMDFFFVCLFVCFQKSHQIQRRRVQEFVDFPAKFSKTRERLADVLDGGGKKSKRG